MWFINRYRKGVPFPKKVLEDIVYRLRFIILYFLNGFRVRTVLFYPAYPSKRSVLYKMLKVLRYNRTNNPRQAFDAAIHWETETFRKLQPLLEQIRHSKRVINFHCRDISKKYIDGIHHEVFGYSSIIDPTTHNGPCVKKNNLNALHDGEVIECPVSDPDPDFVYQLLINNTSMNGMVEDIRIPVLPGEIPLAYLKYKPVEKRFGSFLTTGQRQNGTRIVNPAEVFSAAELEQIRTFARRINLEYGELDILRDRDNGRLYIIDANNTPTGPSHLDKKTRKHVIGLMADAFRRHFLQQVL